ncbi:MAG TPA: hypothetical protein VF323_03380 [Candidatus Limnocylindrales bacterium]
MTDDAGKEGEWVTGIIGEPFQVDKDGMPIPGSAAEPPTDMPSASDIWDADDATQGSPEIGGADDETQKEIWAAMDRGDFGPAAGSTPSDAETTN